jgi:hypothetical protein
MVGANDEIPVMNVGALAMGATGDKATVTMPFKGEVCWTAVALEGSDAAAIGGVVTFARRPLTGSDTGRVVFSTVTKPNSTNVQGKPLVDVINNLHIELNAGEQIVCAVTTANGAAVNFTAQVCVRRVPEKWENMNAIVMPNV